MDTPFERITLRDGRQLAYAEYGDPAGAPLFHFHGWPSSRLEGAVLDAAADRLGVRLIAPDRPGLGRSTQQRGRRLLDWPDDVSQLADALGIGEFAVVGLSGGGPYAVACAAGLDERLRAAGVVSGVGPTEFYSGEHELWRNRWSRRLGRWAPTAMRPLIAFSLWQLNRNPDGFLTELGSSFPEADRAALGDPAFQSVLASSAREALAEGTAGAAQDNALLSRSWGIDLGAIERPVYLWHGELDPTAPVAVARRLAAAIPGCEAVYGPADGHASMLLSHAEAILGTLCGVEASTE